MTEIYIADTTPLADDVFFEEMSGFLPVQRRERIGKYRTQKDKCCGLAAGLLLEYGLRQHGYTLLDGIDFSRTVLEMGEFGKPYLLGNPLYFNLSHSGKYAAAAFDRQEIGVDIECIRKVNLRLARRFFTPDEYEWLEQTAEEEKDRAFTLLWTKKESYIKAVGRGMSLPLTDFSVQSGEIPFFSWEKEGEYCLSVCGKNLLHTDVVVREVNLQEIF